MHGSQPYSPTAAATIYSYHRNSPYKLVHTGNIRASFATGHEDPARGENSLLKTANAVVEKTSHRMHSPECHMCDELGLVELWDTHVAAYRDAFHCPSLQPDREQQILFDSHDFLSLNRLLLDESLRQDLEIATNYENSEFSSLTSSGARFPKYTITINIKHFVRSSPNSLCNCYQITDLTAVL